VSVSRVLWCVHITIHLQNKGCILPQTQVYMCSVCEYKHSYCTPFYMFAVKDIMNVLQEDVHKLWKFHSEQRKMEKLSLAGLLLLLQLNTLHNLLRV